MRRFGFSTRAIHGRPATDAPGEPVVQPIVTSSTFSFEDAATFGRVMSGEEYGFLYSRLRNPTVEDLNSVLADLEGQKRPRRSLPEWQRSRRRS
jgi:methionine-gamma-lyase